MEKKPGDLADFVFEMGQLKRVRRSGWWVANVAFPESVADHSFRTAILGYLLARLENADANKVMGICLFHDIHEARINDLHKIGHKYIDFRAAEDKAFSEQVSALPENIRESLAGMHEEMRGDSTIEGTLARDADLLECAFQAKEYIEIGHASAQDWIDNIKKLLRTNSAKEILEEVEKKSSADWWHGLKKPER